MFRGFVVSFMALFVLFRGLSWQPFASDCLHQPAEPVELVESGVNVGRDAYALELLVHDRRRENAVFVEEITADRRRIDTNNLDVCNRTRLSGIE